MAKKDASKDGGEAKGSKDKKVTSSARAAQNNSNEKRITIIDLLLPMAIIAVAGSMVAAYFGFTGREEQVIGVDLGTTFSVVAVQSGDGVRVIPNYQSDKKTTPSCVTFHPNGTVIVGEECTNFRQSHPLNSIYNAKRFIGSSFDVVAANPDLLDYPFNVEDVTEMVKNLPKKKGVERLKSHAWFRVPTTGESTKLVSPEEIGSEILKVLRDSVVKAFDWDVTKAVACVPADFNGMQRLATKKAFEMAGLTVVRMMEEPTCAAVAYNLDLIPEPRHIMVYDIGGGTLDCSMLFMNGDGGQTTNRKGQSRVRGSITVLGSEGDPHFGGSDFDEAMLNLLKQQWDDQLMEGELTGGAGSCADEYLRVKAENAKILLSSTDKVTVECTKGDETTLTTTITRQMFETICAPLYDRALLPVDRLFEMTDKEEDDVNFVVLVGGASRLPMLYDLLADRFGKDKLRNDIDPDLTVAIGAATIVD